MSEYAYVDFPGEQSLRAPGDLEDTRFFYFVLRADEGRLRALCDRYLNAPSGGQLAYAPLGVVLLAFSHVERLRSADPSRGTITYKDIAFWVPVWGGKTKPLCLFPPFIFVDDASTMATGREVFGLPKQLGRFEMPLSYEGLSRARKPEFRAEVVGTLQPGGQNDWRTLLTVQQVTKEETSDSQQFFSALQRMLLPSALRELTVPSWLSHLGAVPVVGLKQFRDAASSGSACYQAVVEAPLSTKKVLVPPRFLFDAFELRLMDVPSHPVADVLGLSPDPQRVPLAICFQSTMQMDPGTVVWRTP
jgi:hypothetical protein